MSPGQPSSMREAASAVEPPRTRDRPPRSLRTRLLVLLATLVLVGTALQLAAAFRAAVAEADDLFDYHMRQIALSLRDAGVASVAPSAFGAPADFDFVVQVWSADGRRVYQSHRHAWLPDEAVLGFAVIRAPDGDWRTFSVATGERVIQVAQNVAVRRELALRYAARSLWPTLLFGALLLAGVWWVVTSSLAPIARARDELSRRDADALSPVHGDGLPAEVAPLVVEFNRLMARVRDALDARERFIGDAAHELRTPIAALKLQLQMLERAPDDAARATALSRLHEGIERAGRLVGQLLVLERLQAEAPAALQASAPVARAVHEALASLNDAASARGITVDTAEVDPSVTASASPGTLETLLRNLLDNAIRYTPPAGRIAVSVRTQGPQLEIAVDDSGPGIPAADRERVFDRFYRRPGERAQGSGLGLAIVQAIVRRLHGRITLGDSPLGGLRASVVLPASDPTPRPTSPPADQPPAGAPHSDDRAAAP